MAMISTVTFNGKSLNPKRFRIQHLPDYTIAERDQEQLHVEGRDGDLVLDAKSYKNVPRKYSISFGADGPEDFATAVSEISKWLDCGGYCELEDTYDPEYFWLAVPVGSPKVYSILNGYMGKVDIEFSCQPRKYLKYGRTPIQIDAAFDPMDTAIFRIYNPSEYDAKPVIYVYPKGFSKQSSSGKTVKIQIAENIDLLNGSPPQTPEDTYYEVDIDLSPRYGNLFNRFNRMVIVDCERENAYGPDLSGSGDIVNLNSYVSLLSDEYPVLKAKKNNTIFIKGDVTDIAIIPGYWTR